MGLGRGTWAPRVRGDNSSFQPGPTGTWAAWVHSDRDKAACPLCRSRAMLSNYPDGINPGPHCTGISQTAETCRTGLHRGKRAEQPGGRLPSRLRPPGAQEAGAPVQAPPLRSPVAPPPPPHPRRGEAHFCNSRTDKRCTRKQDQVNGPLNKCGRL